jgi:hypothetical protein
VDRPEQIIVIVPCQDRIVPQVDEGLRALERLGVRVHRAFGQSAIDAARSRLATQALKNGYKEILWIDADVAFTVADVERIRSHGLLIVGGIYAKKGVPELACAQLPQTQAILFEPTATLVEVQYLPAGFLYTRAEAYAAIQAKFNLPLCYPDVEPAALVPYFWPMILTEGDKPRYLGEDFAFCHRAREAGIRVMADPAIRLAHFGPYPYTLEDCITRKSLLPRLRLSFVDPPPNGKTPESQSAVSATSSQTSTQGA